MALVYRHYFATSVQHPLSRYAFDERWGYKHSNVVGESGTVCDWTGVGDDETDLPTCVKGICGGHNKLDVLPFEVKVKRE